MISNCKCPPGNHLPDLIIPDCKESVGQVQKVIFTRMSETEVDGTIIPAYFTIEDELPYLESMLHYLTEPKDFRILVSPFLQNPTTESGAARTFGGGNQTLNGLEVVIGSEKTHFSSSIYQESQEVIKILKELQCEHNLGVYLINERGDIVGIYGIESGGGTEALFPIPITNFFVGDKNLGGLEEPDSNTMEWDFLPNWSDDLFTVKRKGMVSPLGHSISAFDYNPLTDIVIPEEPEPETLYNGIVLTATEDPADNIIAVIDALRDYFNVPQSTPSDKVIYLLAKSGITDIVVEYEGLSDPEDPTSLTTKKWHLTTFVYSGLDETTKTADTCILRFGIKDEVLGTYLLYEI